MKWLYEIALGFFFLAHLPKFIKGYFFADQKYRGTLRQRLGMHLPHFIKNEGQKVIWIHAVSLGEAKAIEPLYRRLKETFPSADFVISTSTKTGYAEAERSLEGASAYFFLPFDFMWIVRKAVQRYQPDLLVLSEGDLWLNLCSLVRQYGGKVALMSGKMSARSAQRYRLLPWFTKQLMQQIDFFGLQNQQYRMRFEKLGACPEKMAISGNFKLQSSKKELKPDALLLLKTKFNIRDATLPVLIISTHNPEEKLLLNIFKPLCKELPQLKILLAPRHPERFDEVYKFAHHTGWRPSRWNEVSHSQLIIMDRMGEVASGLQLAKLALVGGSFIEGVGGHNVYEPLLYNVPTLFGPYMHAQEELAELALGTGAAKQLGLDELKNYLNQIFSDPSLLPTLQEKASHGHEPLRRAFQESSSRLEGLLLGINS